VKSVRIAWGDHRRTTVRVKSNGTFTARHRYRKAGRYRIGVTATDKAGNRTLRHLTARVRSRRA
jgi:hypothetical protein